MPAEAGIQAPAPGQALRLRSATLRTNGQPFVLSVARKGGVEAWMPDHVRHDGNPCTATV